MNLNQLRYFLVLAEVGSYSEAAFQLDIAQSTLSQSMINLEQELNTPLFYSEKRISYLTGAGEVLRNEAQKILADVAESKEKIAQYLDGNLGSVTIGVSGSFGVTIVPQVINLYRKYHPQNQLTVRLVQGNTEQLIQRLSNHEIDLGICSYWRRNEFVEFSAIKREPYVVITPVNHELVRQTSVSVADILKYPMVTFSTRSGAYYDVANILNVDMEQLDIAMQVDDPAMMAALVASGVGIAVIPRIYLLDHFEVKILPLAEARHRDVYCAWLKYQMLSPVAKEFRSLIQQSCEMSGSNT
ncbi:LysR family transcriptional regulator [Lacticaseibacillus chiayiensis]|uniref:LysR family transcriptional regulator n=1 Tax=Lacticaseibacillus chiayiensis TaxID=2100821 RepID=A0A4Q1U5L9_9LACO|nr:LysR family transcriptional regulator [Lacticaseibacillus chiayiensis]QVI35071.1 LysR family transcriptional regulator [Lacticaseibacillus chiayiensis]RXT26583.1 LysR family transcriptional regulator [Lacticaseibacillus chiayiensis]UYN56853.1 LysR family transcriptional regulator [Lacticaseibacillus chiayiensis]